MMYRFQTLVSNSSRGTTNGVASTVANARSTFVITAVDINGTRVQTGGLKFVVTLVPFFSGGTKVLLAQQNRIDTGAGDTNVIVDEGDGGAVQVDPMKPKLKPSGTKRVETEV